jgi:hypothetical protein
MQIESRSDNSQPCWQSFLQYSRLCVDENVDNDVLDSARISLIVLLVWFVVAKKMTILGRRTLLDINFFKVVPTFTSKVPRHSRGDGMVHRPGFSVPGDIRSESRIASGT